jgi:hypothetical protein
VPAGRRRSIGRRSWPRTKETTSRGDAVQPLRMITPRGEARRSPNSHTTRVASLPGSGRLVVTPNGEFGGSCPVSACAWLPNCSMPREARRRGGDNMRCTSGKWGDFCRPRRVEGAPSMACGWLSAGGKPAVHRPAGSRRSIGRLSWPRTKETTSRGDAVQPLRMITPRGEARRSPNSHTTRVASLPGSGRLVVTPNGGFGGFCRLSACAWLPNCSMPREARRRGGDNIRCTSGKWGDFCRPRRVEGSPHRRSIGRRDAGAPSGGSRGLERRRPRRVGMRFNRYA